MDAGKDNLAISQTTLTKSATVDNPWWTKTEKNWLNSKLKQNKVLVENNNTFADIQFPL